MESVIDKNVTLQVTRQNYRQASTDYRGFQVPDIRQRSSLH
jgi:hypothetical protein